MRLLKFSAVPTARPPETMIDERHNHTLCPGYISEHDGSGEYFFLVRHVAPNHWRRANAAKA